MDLQSIKIIIKVMPESKSTKLSSLLRRLWNHLPVRRHKQFAVLLILIILASFAEVLSIGAVLPFLSVLTNPEVIYNNYYLKPILVVFGIDSPKELFFPIMILFAVAAIFAGLIRILLLWVSMRLSFATGADFSNTIYIKTLYQPYSIHVSRNSSEVISGITGKANGLVYSILLPIINILGSIFIIGSILGAIISMNPAIAISSFLGFGSIYALIAFLAKNRLKNNSEIISLESDRVFKSLQEGLGGIRDVLLDGSQAVYCGIYKESDQRLRQALASNSFTAVSPRYAMEAMGLVLIAGFAYFVSGQGSITNTLPILGALALGAQRLLPVLQQGYYAWAVIRSSDKLLLDVLELLDQPLPKYANLPKADPLVFNTSIDLINCSFRYNLEGPWIIRNLNLSIPKGNRIGFIGETGSGKSTLIDIIMALLTPTEGQLSIDACVVSEENVRSWQSTIAHVPQHIFLSDTSIAENIAFGSRLEEIDIAKVKIAAEKAQLAKFIQELKYGYDTKVGERGVRLSGGQRQRIGIARALYKDAKVIIFDEATSALDNETEKAVMEAINGLGRDLTVIMIAHRLSTVQECDKIIELSNGSISRIGTYKEIFLNGK